MKKVLFVLAITALAPSAEASLNNAMSVQCSAFPEAVFASLQRARSLDDSLAGRLVDNYNMANLRCSNSDTEIKCAGFWTATRSQAVLLIKQRRDGTFVGLINGQKTMGCIPNHAKP